MELVNFTTATAEKRQLALDEMHKAINKDLDQRLTDATPENPLITHEAIRTIVAKSQAVVDEVMKQYGVHPQLAVEVMGVYISSMYTILDYSTSAYQALKDQPTAGAVN